MRSLRTHPESHFAPPLDRDRQIPLEKLFEQWKSILKLNAWGWFEIDYFLLRDVDVA
jgi:hypothetical protein